MESYKGRKKSEVFALLKAGYENNWDATDEISTIPMWGESNLVRINGESVKFTDFNASSSDVSSLIAFHIHGKRSRMIGNQYQPFLFIPVNSQLHSDTRYTFFRNIHILLQYSCRICEFLICVSYYAEYCFYL